LGLVSETVGKKLHSSVALLLGFIRDISKYPQCSLTHRALDLGVSVKFLSKKVSCTMQLATPGYGNHYVAVTAMNSFKEINGCAKKSINAYEELIENCYRKCNNI
jgi:hypothetical protein